MCFLKFLANEIGNKWKKKNPSKFAIKVFGHSIVPEQFQCACNSNGGIDGHFSKR